MTLGRAAPGCKTPGPLLLAIAAAAFFTACWLLALSPAISAAGPVPQALSASDRTTVLSALEHYSVLARNMSVRISTAEQALLELQRRLDRFRQQSKPFHGFERPPANAADHTGEENSEGESDAEREKRQTEEEQEQRKLILYNESTKTYRRWRPDFLCGNKVPALPDDEPVECEPGGEAPCCSSLGWCGKSQDHCECGGCTDYRSSVKITMKGVKLRAAQRECDSDSIAHSFDTQPSPEVCAPLVLQQVECGRLLMFSHKYPNWGCRCCMPRTGEPFEMKEHLDWNVYEVEVEVTLAEPAEQHPA